MASKKASKKSKHAGKGATVPPKPPPAPHPPVPVPQKYCVRWNMYALTSEIDAGAQNTTVGGNHMFPVYFGEGNEINDSFMGTPGGKAGMFLDATTLIGAGNGDCIFEGSFLFGEANAEGVYENQLAVAGTCLGTANTIIGGTGDFACATGYEYFTGDTDAEMLNFTTYYCSGCDWGLDS